MVLLGQSPAAQQLEESRDGGLAACNLAMRLCGGSAPSAYRPPLPRRSHVSPGVVSASAGGGRSQLRCSAPCRQCACSRTDSRTLCLRGHGRWSEDRRRPARAFGPGIVGLVASPAALAWVRVPLIAHHAARTLAQPRVIEVTEQTVAPVHALKLALSMRTTASSKAVQDKKNPRSDLDASSQAWPARAERLYPPLGNTGSGGGGGGGGGSDTPAGSAAAAGGQKRVMILMSDTGGGHRASAEALKSAFHIKFGALLLYRAGSRRPAFKDRVLTRVLAVFARQVTSSMSVSWICGPTTRRGQ